MSSDHVSSTWVDDAFWCIVFIWVEKLNPCFRRESRSSLPLSLSPLLVYLWNSLNLQMCVAPRATAKWFFNLNAVFCLPFFAFVCSYLLDADKVNADNLIYIYVCIGSSLQTNIASMPVTTKYTHTHSAAATIEEWTHGLAPKYAFAFAMWRNSSTELVQTSLQHPKCKRKEMLRRKLYSFGFTFVDIIVARSHFANSIGVCCSTDLLTLPSSSSALLPLLAMLCRFAQIN